MRMVGSSPRGRGKHGDESINGLDNRLIPAWAGKTVGIRASRGARTAHPRVGGENRAFDVLGVGRMGSSPRGRGKRARPPRTQPPHRLIPAWAGKTVKRVLVDWTLAAHPRVGGENPPDLCGHGSFQGSSPRGRGKRVTLDLLDGLHGLIPAWAGKTVAHELVCVSRGAHPRVGGENPQITVR